MSSHISTTNYVFILPFHRQQTSRPISMAKKRKPQPLAPPPQSSALRSRKRARQVTTLFHKYSQKKDEAIARAKAGGCDIDDNSNEIKPTSTSQHDLLEEVRKWDRMLAEIGGREEYQRASQMNTNLFSTSKWVLGVLGKWGWLDGLPDEYITNAPKKLQPKKRKAHPKRDIRLLEIGAINTQLLDAAARTRFQKSTQHEVSSSKQRVHRLDVHAIDIRSTDDRIQEIDFFDLPLPHVTSNEGAQQRPAYDVLVNSMVINCVTAPEQRGKMLRLCYQQLRPGGVLFLTLPKLCLKQSRYMTCKYFEDILTDGVGFEIMDESTKDSPKLAFFVLKRPEIEKKTWRADFGCMRVLNDGKKFRNNFACILSQDDE